MEDFNWTTFTKKIAVAAPLSELYDAWTVPEKIESWFLSKAEYQTPNGEAVARNQHVQDGDTYWWSWYLYDITEKGKITKANGTDELQFTFAGECPVDIKLTPVKDNVVVELTQRNIPTDDQSKRGIRLGCDSGWSFFLVNLKSIYEGGIDLRNKDSGLQGMLNN